ncbi:MAG: methyltransferase domain-containing protein [Planctomycetota bacterium]
MEGSRNGTIAAVGADAHPHRLYAEHAGLPIGVVTQCAQNHGVMAQEAWLDLGGTGRAERVVRFQERGEESLFDLLSREPTRQARLERYQETGVWAEWAAAGPDVLDFGGGLGATSALLAEAGKSVRYVDLEGAVARFAEWYLVECGGPHVSVAHTPGDTPRLPGDRFDLVLVENVLEYVADPGMVVEALVRALAPAGQLWIRLDPRPASPCEPHRRELDLDALLARAPALRGPVRRPFAVDGWTVFQRR